MTQNTMKPLNTHVYSHTFSSIFVKFAVCFLLLGLAYRLFSSSVLQFSPVVVPTDIALDKDKEALPPHPPVSSSDLSVNHTSKTGNWIWKCEFWFFRIKFNCFMCVVCVFFFFDAGSYEYSSVFLDLILSWEISQFMITNLMFMHSIKGTKVFNLVQWLA